MANLQYISGKFEVTRQVKGHLQVNLTRNDLCPQNVVSMIIGLSLDHWIIAGNFEVTLQVKGHLEVNLSRNDL